MDNETTVARCQCCGQEMRPTDLAQRLRDELARTQARLNWAANELLACDYGDNPENKGVGWTVFGWRDVNGVYSVVPYEKARRIYGRSINEAIDAELARSPKGVDAK